MNTVQTVPIQNGPFQVPGYVLAPAPPQTRTSARTRPGYKARLVTGVIQALLGTVLVLCGIVVIVLRYPERDNYDSSTGVRYNTDDGERLDGVDRQSWAIWMGIVVVITSLFGFLSKRNQAVISLYMVFSIVGSLVSFVGMIVAAQYVGRTVTFRNQLTFRVGEIRSYFYPCEVSSSYRYNPTPDPSLQSRYNECLDLHIKAAAAHLPFYCIMLICFVVGFVVAIVGASSTCVGLDCCSSSPARTRQQFVYLQQAPVQMPPPQLNMVDPPPPYTALNFPQPTTNQQLHGTSPSPAPNNYQPAPASGSRAGETYLQPDVTSRRLQSSTLPKPPQQQQQTGDSEYLALDSERPPETNPAYVEPNTGEPPRTDAMYLEPNSAGSTSQTDAAYLEPNATRQPQGNQNDSYTYEYADPREGQRPSNGAAGSNEDYITVIL